MQFQLFLIHLTQAKNEWQPLRKAKNNYRLVFKITFRFLL